MDSALGARHLPILRKNYISKQIRLVSSSAATNHPRTKRPVVILPGLGNNSKDYTALASDLRLLGLEPEIAQVSRPDWLRNAAGLVDSNYWKGTLKPRPVLDWYLERIQTAINAAKEKASEGTKVSLIGHSAGGWLARLFLFEFGTDDVELLLTLGTPHLPPPRGASGVVDQTRGLLYHIEETCPGAYHYPDVKYVCVAGRYLRGQPFFKRKETQKDAVVSATLGLEEAAFSSTASSSQSPSGFSAFIVGQGYKQVCGESEVWGDGVVPEISAQLSGAVNIILDGAYHSPVGAGATRPWFGSAGKLEQWVEYLLE